MKTLVLLSIILVKFLFSFSQETFIVKNTQVLGNSQDDMALSVAATTDGGYIVAGYTTSTETGNKDAWILKFSKKDKLQWQKILGGNLHDEMQSIAQTGTGTYIAAGMTQTTSSGLDDIWVINLNRNGNLIWDKNFGGDDDDDAKAIATTADGGCIVAANTWSNTLGKDDILLLKLDAYGSSMWQRDYGDFSWDEATSVISTTDGGYIVGGYTESKAKGEGAVWILKLDNNGSLEWDKLYGIGKAGSTASIIQSDDEGYTIAGYIYNSETKDLDMWIFKIDKNGDLQWEKTYGGNGDEKANKIIQTETGYIVAGYTTSKGAGKSDFWIIELDRNGELKREITLGTKKSDIAYSVTQVKAGDYIVVGSITTDKNDKNIEIVRLKH